MPQHQCQRLTYLLGRVNRNQRPAGQLAHRQRIERPAIQNGPLQVAGGEDAQTGGIAGCLHQHIARTLLPERPNHLQHRHRRRHHPGRTHPGIGHPRHVQRLQFLPRMAPGSGPQLLPQRGEQQCTEGIVGGDQPVDGLVRQLVDQYLIHRHIAAARIPRHQCPAVEAVVGPVGGQHLLTLELLHIALDHHEQVCRPRAGLQQHLAGPEAGNVDLVAHQPLFGRVQTVEGRDRKIEGVGHGCLPGESPRLRVRGPSRTPGLTGYPLGRPWPRYRVRVPDIRGQKPPTGTCRRCCRLPPPPASRGKHGHIAAVHPRVHRSWMLAGFSGAVDPGSSAFTVQ